jgi:hypothetical protein
LATESRLKAFCNKNPLEQFSQIFSKSMRLCVLTNGVPLPDRNILARKNDSGPGRGKSPRIPLMLRTRTADLSKAPAKPPGFLGFSLIGDNRCEGRSRLTPSHVTRRTFHVRTAHCPEVPVSCCH